MHKYAVHILTICFFCHSPLTVSEPKQAFTIGVTEWEPYLMKNGEGLYHDLWRETFKRVENYYPAFEYSPFKRSLKDFNDGDTDGISSLYRHQVTTDYLVGRWHIGWGRLSVFSKAGSSNIYSDLEDFEGKRVAWIRGYEFDVAGVITQSIEVSEVDTTVQGFNMLRKGRIDYYVEYHLEYENLVDSKVIDPSNYNIYHGALQDAHYYFAVRNTEAGQAIINAWDAAMESLHREGLLQERFVNQVGEEYLAPPPLETLQVAIDIEPAP